MPILILSASQESMLLANVPGLESLLGPFISWLRRGTPHDRHDHRHFETAARSQESGLPIDGMNGVEREALYERIIAENARRIRIIARSNARSGNAEDLEQEILLAIWKGLDTYAGRSNPATWVYSVAINIVKLFNRKGPRPEVLVNTLPETAALTSGDGLNRGPTEILEEFIASLESDDRQVFLMYLDDLSYREMSEAMQIEETNLRKRVSRLKQLFSARYIGR